MGCIDNLPVFPLSRLINRVPFNTFLCIILSILSMSICFGKYLWMKFPLLIRSPNSLRSRKNYLSSLWNILDMTPS